MPGMTNLNKLVLLILNVEQSVASLAELLHAGRVVDGQAGQASIAWRKLCVIEKRILVGGESIKSRHNGLVFGW
jgi:hypothetical protein